MVNLATPPALAVKMSPTPELSMTRPAKDVLAEIEAAEVVPLKGELPVTLKVALVEAVPPTSRSRVWLPK